jgi:hypothetical protein
MTSSELYLHIGYPKTGTTFLQAELFPKLQGVHYVPRSGVRNEMAKMIRQDELSFDYDGIKRDIESQFSNGKNLISNEGLVGTFVLYKGINNKLIADRLFRLFPDAKILITIRSQYRLIESLYKQYVQVGGTASLREFANFRNGRFNYSYCEWDLTINPEMFDYLKLIGYYEKLFPKENIIVLPHELLKSDPVRFVSRVVSWMDLTETPLLNHRQYNPGYGSRQIAIARFLNRFLKSKYRETALIPQVSFPVTGKIDSGKLRRILQSSLSRKLLGQKPITDEVLKAEITKRYAPSNRELNQKYRLSLEELEPSEYF